MQIFFSIPFDDNTLLLPEKEAHHCLNVLRHKVGDEIVCIDGVGKKYQAKIHSKLGREAILTVESTEEKWGEGPKHIILGIGMLRLADRFEYAIEKAVELGANEIVPLRCEHVTKYPKFKKSRLENIIHTAAKQSKRSVIPVLHDPTEFKYFDKNFTADATLIAACEAETPIQKLVGEIDRSKTLCLMIGPEGDFSPNELNLAENLGWFPISLGKNRLRTETAAIHALSMVKLQLGY